MPAMRRKLGWVERKDFSGWACSECLWVFNSAGPPIGETLDEMVSHFERQRDKEFTSHLCAEHPRARNSKG